MSEVWNPPIVAMIATIAMGMQISSTQVCDFVSVQAKEGDILAITKDSEQKVSDRTEIGLNCEGGFYNVEDDQMWKTANAFTLLALAFGVMAFLLCWTSVIVSPTLLLWRTITATATITGLLQLPGFAVFGSFPCSDHREQQECSLAGGSYFLIVGAVSWLCAAICTLVLDPPLWRQHLHLWLIPKDGTLDADSDSPVDLERNMDEGSQDPIFASGLEQSDALSEKKQERKPLVSWLKTLIDRYHKGDERERRRVVQKFSFALSSAVAAATGQRELQNNQVPPESSDGDGTEVGVLMVLENGAMKETHNHEQQGSNTEPTTSPNKTGPPSLSAGESILDSITGEESILDASVSGSERQTPEDQRQNAPSPTTTLNNEKTAEKLLGEESTASTSSSESDQQAPEEQRRNIPSPLTTLNDDELKAVGVSGTPVYQGLEKENRAFETEAIMKAAAHLSILAAREKTVPRDKPQVVVEIIAQPKEKSCKTSARGIFVLPTRKAKGYQRMLEDDDNISTNREVPPMAEVMISKDKPVHNTDNSPERNLLSEWNDLFDVDNAGSSDADSSRDDDVDRVAQPDASDEDDPYLASSENEDTGKSSASEGFATLENEDPDDDSVEDDDPSQKNPKRVLRPPRIRRRRVNEGSVSSAPSLLSYTIEEETEQDLADSSVGEDYASVSGSTSSKDEPGRLLPRARSTPNLNGLGSSIRATQVAKDVNTTGLNSHRSMQVYRYSDDTNALLSQLSGAIGAESTIAGPLPFLDGQNQLQTSDLKQPQSFPQPAQRKRSKSLDDDSAMDSCLSCLSGIESAMTGPLLSTEALESMRNDTAVPPPCNDVNTIAESTPPAEFTAPNSPPTPPKSPVSRQKRSQSQEKRSRACPAQTLYWKPDSEIRTGMHRAASYVSSSDSSDGSSLCPNSRGKVREARINRLKSQHISSSGATGPSVSRRTRGGYGLSKRALRELREVSPDPSSEDVSLTTTSDIDVTESYLLDNVDVTLAHLARDSDDEYGPEEGSV